MAGAVERVWYGAGAASRAARALLAPASLAFGTLTRARNALYDRGALRAYDAGVPVLSVGNLSVGGTGKTPMAAWAVARLRARGGRPAIVMRGYGGDEPMVHARLNPDVPVVADSDRVRGARAARAAGADCVVLDDGFQHRRIARTADWVLLPAERSASESRLLPAGPLREPLAALRRAHLVIVTRKSASAAHADALASRLERESSRAVAVCLLEPDGLVDAVTAEPSPLERLAGARLLGVAAIGAPDAFFAQLRDRGAAAVEALAYADHHRFTASDAIAIARAAERRDAVVCTLKDAVKLAPLWPRAAVPLWYVSQRVVIERGGAALDASVALILSARAGSSSTAGAAG